MLDPVKKHLKALVFFTVSKKIPIVYSADRGRAEIIRKLAYRKSKKISNDQELIQSDPVSCPQNQKGNN